MPSRRDRREGDRSAPDAGFDTPAEENCAQLDDIYRDTKRGYGNEGYGEVTVAGVRGYVWRLSDIEDGRRIRKVDVLFDLGADSFAVLTSSRQTGYDELKTLATRVPDTVWPTT